MEDNAECESLSFSAREESAVERGTGRGRRVEEGVSQKEGRKKVMRGRRLSAMSCEMTSVLPGGFQRHQNVTVQVELVLVWLRALKTFQMQ